MENPEDSEDKKFTTLSELEALGLRIKAAAIDPNIKPQEVWFVLRDMKKARVKYKEEEFLLFLDLDCMKIVMQKFFDNLKTGLEKYEKSLSE